MDKSGRRRRRRHVHLVVAVVVAEAHGGRVWRRRGGRIARRGVRADETRRHDSLVKHAHEMRSRRRDVAP
eukprot:3960183-Pleurochrysis_carterae.AAC.1